MNEPLVSVVIPAYNGGMLLRAAIDSVLAQDYAAPMEIVVVDDGSTQPIAPFLADVADRVRIVPQPNAGTAAARNHGVRAARGEYVAFLDQDDLWDAHKLSRQVPLFRDDEIALVHAGARFVDAAGTVTSVVAADPGLDTHALLAACRLAVQTAVVRRSVLDEIGGFDESLSAADDWDMWIRIVDRYRMAAVPDVLATIRVHPGNQSRDAELMYASALRVMTKHRHLHGACDACGRALREADRLNRASYYGRMRERARVEAAAGNRRAAARITAQALRRNPRALIETPMHHLRRLTARRHPRGTATS
jgi:glycosyltransferase involved in cell wall biosynthesis